MQFRAMATPVAELVGKAAEKAETLDSRRRPASGLSDPFATLSRNDRYSLETFVSKLVRPTSTLDGSAYCSLYVLMQVRALSAGWRVHSRCLGGVVDNTRSRAKCHYQAELSLETLVWTRGRSMSLAGLRDRMMCPRCGNRRVDLIFEPPPVAVRAPVA